MGKRENAGFQHFVLSLQGLEKIYFLGVFKTWDCLCCKIRSSLEFPVHCKSVKGGPIQGRLKGGPSDLRTKFYKNTKKSFLYSQSLLNFIHKTPVAENHPKTRKIRDLLCPSSKPTGNTVYFYMISSLIYTPKIQTKLQT